MRAKGRIGNATGGSLYPTGVSYSTAKSTYVVKIINIRAFASIYLEVTNTSPSLEIKCRAKAAIDSGSLWIPDESAYDSLALLPGQRGTFEFTSTAKSEERKWTVWAELSGHAVRDDNRIRVAINLVKGF